MNTFNLPRNFACKPSTPCMGVHLHANFQPTWQNWTGTLNYQLCSVNAGEVCKLTFRPDPQFARELAALPPKVCTQTCNRPSQVCMQTCMPAGKSLHANFQSPLASLHATSWKFACKLACLRAKVCMQTSNPPSQVCTQPLGSLHANFHCLVRNELKKHLKNQRATFKKHVKPSSVVSVSSGGMSGQPALSFGQGLNSIKTHCSISAAVLSLEGKNTK